MYDHKASVMFILFIYPFINKANVVIGNNANCFMRKLFWVLYLKPKTLYGYTAYNGIHLILVRNYIKNINMGSTTIKEHYYYSHFGKEIVSKLCVKEECVNLDLSMVNPRLSKF